MSGKKLFIPAPVIEYNTAVFGLIACQSKKPADKFRFGWIYESPDGSYSISCRTGHPFGVPYGLCNDIISGIMTAFSALQISEGENPWLELTLAEIAKLAGLAPKEEHYRIIGMALESMKDISYTLINCYQNPVLGESRRGTASFHIISNFYIDEKKHSFNSRQTIKTYRILLDPMLAASIRGPQTLSLARDILSKLNSPTSRSLYRYLDIRRRDLSDPQRTYGEIHMPLEEFISSVRVLSDSPYLSVKAANLIRKNGPLDALCNPELGFLESYYLTGRGDSTVISFRFYPGSNAVDMRGVRRLEGIGVSSDKASSAMEAHTLEEVECAIWLMDTSKAVKDNPAGYVLRLLKNGSARNNLQRFRERPKTKPTGTIDIDMQEDQRVKSRIQHSLPETEPQQPEITLETEFRALQATKRMDAKHIQTCKKLLEKGLIKLDELVTLRTIPSSEVMEKIQEWGIERLGEE